MAPQSLIRVAPPPDPGANHFPHPCHLFATPGFCLHLCPSQLYSSPASPHSARPRLGGCGRPLWFGQVSRQRLVRPGGCPHRWPGKWSRPLLRSRLGGSQSEGAGWTLCVGSEWGRGAAPTRGPSSKWPKARDAAAPPSGRTLHRDRRACVLTVKALYSSHLPSPVLCKPHEHTLHAYCELGHHRALRSYKRDVISPQLLPKRGSPIPNHTPAAVLLGAP